MVELTAQNVEDVLKDSLYSNYEDASNMIVVEGVISKYGFKPEGIERNRNKINELLSQLPATFNEETGGGWSFLNACVTKDGEQWGQHRDIDNLLCLGIAAGRVALLMQRSIWPYFPGGMPYFVIKKLS